MEALIRSLRLPSHPLFLSIEKVFRSRPGWPRFYAKTSPVQRLQACATMPTLVVHFTNIPERHRRAGIVDRLLYAMLLHSAMGQLCGYLESLFVKWNIGLHGWIASLAATAQSSGRYFVFVFKKPQIPRLQTNPINIFGGRFIASYLKTKEHS